MKCKLTTTPCGRRSCCQHERSKTYGKILKESQFFKKLNWWHKLNEFSLGESLQCGVYKNKVFFKKKSKHNNRISETVFDSEILTEKWSFFMDILNADPIYEIK